MADERFGGMLGMMQGLEERPRARGENPALAGLLGMMERQPASFSTVNGREAVDKMLSESDPSLRFKVYRRSLASSKGDGKRASSGSFAHWLFISEDGKHGFGFNQDGEELEIPDSLEHYEPHPSFKRSYTAGGLIRARNARQKRNDEVNALIRDQAWRLPILHEAPNPDEYFFMPNDCQSYVNDLDRLYKE